MDTLFSCVIADDEPAIVSNLKCASFWKTLGISIIAECSNGELAYQAIQNLKPDFAVIDIRMPLLTGLEVLRKCRENGSSTQILIISGFDDFSYAKQALKYGAKAYVLKPIDFTELAEELQHLILTLEHERKVINQSFSATTFFTDLIEGRIIDSSIIRRMLPSLETELTDTACYTVIFSFAAELANEQYKQVIPLLDSSLTHIRHRFWFKNAKSLVGILNVSDKTPFEVVHALLDSFDGKGYNSVIAGIGDVVPGLYQSTYSYGTAQTALTYRIYNSKERVFSSLHICTDAPPSNENPLHKVDMIKALMTLNKETVSICIRDFLEAVLYVPTPSPNYLYSLCNAFIANANAGLAPLLPSGAVPSVVKEISQALTLDEIIRCLEKYFFAVCEYISRVYGQEKAELLIAEANGCFKDDDALIRKAKVFIKERINKNIHISDVADAVHLSSSYFAIYFKNKTGETLRDYLLQEKMEWASKALLKRAESVEVIADCLGYSDYHAFSRAFKKIYGKSPSAFRADSNE